MDKTVPLEQIGEFVKPGDTVALGGAWLSNHPMAAIRQLVRDGIGDLHAVETMGSVDIDLLAGAGLLSKLTFSMVSFEVFGLAPNFRRGVERGEFEWAELTGLALNTAVEAAARNVPFLPMAPLGLSQVPERRPDSYATISDPFTGAEVLAVRAIKPDVTLLHVLRADAEGNCQYDGPLAIDPEAARAGRRVVVTCEEIVSREVIEANPHMTKIPGFLVDAVIEAPFGAHPTTHVPRYGLDAWSIQRHAEAGREGGEAWAAYVGRIRGESETDYRERELGQGRGRVLEALARAGSTLGPAAGEPEAAR